jgi:hypothetical protein
MTWTGARELKAQLARLWERGDLLRAAASDQSCFPLRLTLRGPASADITNRFEAVRAWSTELSGLAGVRLEWQEIRHRVQGTQRLPTGAWIDTIDDVLSLLGKRRDWERFAALLEETRRAQPALLPWLERRPLQALDLGADWKRLLAVVGWLQAHPRPGIYLRQVDLPGVHTKFIEAHRSVLADLLDLALPAEAIDATRTGVAQFAGRYGFLEKPVRIRFRVLDPRLQAVSGPVLPDVMLDADSFSRLRLAVRRVFITENETNFLAFPPVRESIVLFGAGYGWEALARSAWLHDCTVYYWGDIDTHGFAILDQLRGRFAHVVSFLMDRQTLDAHAAVWGEEASPVLADLSRLTAEEQALYDDLRDNRIRTALRLEQEQIGFQAVHQRLQALLGNAEWDVRADVP